MAGEKEASFWSQALDTYRDVEVAKRSQPRLVQGIQQVQAPLSRNSDAILGGSVSASIADAVPGGSKTLLLLGGGLLAVAALIMLKRKRR